MEKIFKIVEKETGLQRDKLCSSRRYKEMVKGRMLFAVLARREGFSLSTIGRYLLKDHTTVINMLDRAKQNQYIIELADKYDGKRNITIKEDSRYRKYAHIYERFGGKCAVCGFNEIVEIHHIIAKYIGGTDEPENLIVLCPNHHALVHSGQLKIEDINKKS